MNSRWIDQYFLRYAVGTIVGAVIVYYIYLKLPSDFRLDKDLGEWGKIVLLGAGGVAFCYISSAPLLVMHVYRAQILSKERSGVVLWDCVLTTFLPLVLSYSVAAFFGDIPWFSLVAIYCVAFIWLLQTSAVIGAVRFRVDQLIFYKKLAAKRSADKTGIVRSYRDMREHGNAFAIVLFEVFLGVMINGLLDIPDLLKSPSFVFTSALALLGLWVAPAALVLYLAGRLEVDFAEQ